MSSVAHPWELRGKGIKTQQRHLEALFCLLSEANFSEKLYLITIVRDQCQGTRFLKSCLLRIIHVKSPIFASSCEMRAISGVNGGVNKYVCLNDCVIILIP
jgi:hypothetical protein